MLIFFIKNKENCRNGWRISVNGKYNQISVRSIAIHCRNRQNSCTNLLFLTINAWSTYLIKVKVPKFTGKLHLIWKKYIKFRLTRSDWLALVNRHFHPVSLKRKPYFLQFAEFFRMLQCNWFTLATHFRHAKENPWVLVQHSNTEAHGIFPSNFYLSTKTVLHFLQLSSLQTE